MKTLSVVTVCLAVSLLFSGRLNAQDMKPLELSAETSYFDFLKGKWYVTGDPKADTSFAAFQIEQGIHPAAWQEHWFGKKDGKVTELANGIKVWDKTNSQWRFVWVSENGLFQNWEGKKVNNDWYFYHRFDVNGDKYLSRQGWIKTGADTFMRISEKSYDEGKTWELRFKINYVKRP